MPASAATALAPRERSEGHPAMCAWRQLRPGAAAGAVRILKEPRKGVKKSAVYRLAAAGPGGTPVIAKLARRDSAAVEALVYEELLGPLRVAAPAYYGMLDEGGDFCWLFMSDAQGRPYSPAGRRDRRLAGRWLGRLHAAVASLGPVSGLPERGMDHHLRSLDAGRAAVAAHVDDPALARADASVLQRLDGLLGELRSCWPQLERICRELPPTLVHGDFVRKNLRIGRTGNGSSAIAFDWEHAGWGPPALDLARSQPSERLAANACLAAYRRACRAGLGASREEVERQAAAGTVLRILAATQWTSLSLGPSWREGADARRDFLARAPRTLARLQAYMTGLERSLRSLEARGWL
jgi:aminoglycoside phosphotransferase (APT) family kinase protein